MLSGRVSTIPTALSSTSSTYAISIVHALTSHVHRADQSVLFGIIRGSLLTWTILLPDPLLLLLTPLLLLLPTPLPLPPRRQHLPLLLNPLLSLLNPLNPLRPRTCSSSLNNSNNNNGEAQVRALVSPD